MTGKTYPTAAEHRRTARIYSALVVLVVLAVVLFVVLFVGKTPTASAGTYNHLDVCKSTLRGYSSDDDVHNFGVATGAKSFAGWLDGGDHGSDNSAYVYGWFNYTGKTVLILGRCTNGDYSTDWMQG